MYNSDHIYCMYKHHSYTKKMDLTFLIHKAFILQYIYVYEVKDIFQRHY